MELKVVCGCGQKYKFDVDPVDGLMPFNVNCPICGVDGTQSANNLLAQNFPRQPAMAAAAATVSGLRISHAVSPVVSASPPLPSSPRPISPMRSPAVATAPKLKAAGEFNLWLGILGAVLGAGLGAGLMYGFFLLADFRFPLMGTGIGALTGLGARILYKGTDMTLGIIAGSIALFATMGTLYLMFGDVAGMFILSMVVSVSFAYKIAG
jgi:hypothetical protein